MIAVQNVTEFACQQVCMMKELTTSVPSEMEILVGRVLFKISICS